MAKTGKSSNSKTFLIGTLFFLSFFIVLGSFKGIYVNLNNAYGHGYNATLDILTCAGVSILYGFLLGYWIRGKR